MIETEIKAQKLKFKTNANVFSPSSIDTGTLAMLDFIDFKSGDKVLDLGCGYGVVGILAAKILNPQDVYISDISSDAISLSRANLVLNDVEKVNIVQSNGFENIPEKDFNIIASNPPYHEDFKIPKQFIENGYRHLALGGRMFMVTKRRTWYKMKFISVFGGVSIFEKNGYFVFMAEKKENKLKKEKKNHQLLKKKRNRLKRKERKRKLKRKKLNRLLKIQNK